MVKVPRPRPQESQSLAPLAARVLRGEPAEDLLCDPSMIVLPNGVVVDRENADELIDAFESWERKSKEAYAVAMDLRRAIAALASRDPAVTAKTRRIQGERRRAKVEMPDDAWDQPLLRRAWDEFPEHVRDQALKISTIGVKIREWKKLRETTGAGVIVEFRNMIERANRGPVGTPSVTVEK